MLKGKTILLGVSSSIAAYKAAGLASALVKQHANVEVVMTENATKFVTPLVFEQLTGRRAMVDTFDRNFSHQVEHISLATRTDLVIVAPATANVAAKLAHGLADDMLTTTILACKCPKLIAPAMNTNMYENPVTQDNLDILRRYGWEVIEPASGRLACGTTGKGKMPEPEDLMQHILRHLAMPHDLEGKKILVTAGPTQEALDPVRYLTNHSTGKMGYAIARMAMLRGADVTLVSGPTNIAPPPFVNVVNIKSAQDMFEAVSAHAPNMDFIFKAAAVADYTPATYADNKMKKKDGDLSIPLKRTQDILKHLGEHRIPGQVICGFSMETENMLENSRAKLTKKNVDMICANNLKQSGAGFGVDTNIITLITKDDVTELPLLSKEDAANAILNKAMTLAK
ncbi:MAG: bifunctional phosphopantothenoylcysteine decarboxylase/phosphopantothenate--cysteine ligase CoaBC [Oscillospiraceae bacterium]|nr:bifunctional phosphopantothenoylcysteine decarboxylase/phosphopantothenate--cysteine ligase CoaBC [Oscillospiraceae bacterium]